MKKIIAVLLLLAHCQAIADTVIIRPSGNGTYNQAYIYGAATRWECVNESSVDSLTYIWAYPEDLFFTTFQHTSAGFTGSETISKVAITGHVKTGTFQSVAFLLYTHSTLYYSDYFANDYPYDQYFGTFTKEFTVNPNTGIAWTVSEVNDLEFGILLGQDFYEGYSQYCSQLYATVTYTGGGSTSFPTKLLLQGTGK